MTYRKSFLGLALAATTVLAAIAAPAAAQSLKIGIDAAYKPFAYVDESGKLAGFEVELAQAVCQQMKAECDISNVPWDGIFAALESGSIDMIGTTVTKSAARLEKYDASMTIYRVGYAFIVPSDADVAGGLDSLKGKSIGTINGVEAYYKYIQGMLGADADIRGYETTDAAILDLDAGRIAAFQSDNFQLQNQFVSTGKYKYVADPNYDSQWTGDGRGWIFRKGSAELVGPVDAALKAVIADGMVDRLAQKYFGMLLKTE